MTVQTFWLKKQNIIFQLAPGNIFICPKLIWSWIETENCPGLSLSTVNFWPFFLYFLCITFLQLSLLILFSPTDEVCHSRRLYFIFRSFFLKFWWYNKGQNENQQNKRASTSVLRFYSDIFKTSCITLSTYPLILNTFPSSTWHKLH